MTEYAATSIQCRLCDIFACCESCPPDGAVGCFPPHANEDAGGGGGYTPAGWEPTVCDGDDGHGGGDSNGAHRHAAVTLTTVVVRGLSLALAACLAIASVIA
jgi:hypothetical protein